MNELFHLFIFLIILFLYIHITSQYKRSEDLEIYEMDYTTNEHLQEVCDIKQPVLFNYQSVNPQFFETMTLDFLKTYSSSDIKVKESGDYFAENCDVVDYVVLSLQSSLQLITTDTKSAYFIENNNDFVSESSLYLLFQANDELLKPTFTAQTKYDLIMGSKNTVMPLRYHVDYRKFICVTSGKIQVKMTPWKSHKYLYTIKDYDNYDFRSPINVWKPQAKYLHEMDKIKFLEFDVAEGNVLYIPPYWWYSIKFTSDSPIVTEFTYNSVMNCVSNIPTYILYFMQQQNTKTHNTKVLKHVSDEDVDDVPALIEETKTEIQQSIDILKGTHGPV